MTVERGVVIFLILEGEEVFYNKKKVELNFVKHNIFFSFYHTLYTLKKGISIYCKEKETSSLKKSQ